MKPLSLPSVFVAWLLVFFPPGAAAQSGAATGTVSGAVSNLATGNLLQGAKIEVPQLGLSTLADDTGRFVLPNVPAGQHEFVVSYLGLDSIRTQVNVAAGQRTVHDFDLTTGIYKLDAFKVTGEREGAAAAITAQRNAPNVTNVVATDSFGNLPNMTIGEVLMRVPGVASSPSEEGFIFNFNIRGAGAALNTVTIDGGLITGLGTNRAFEVQSITSAMFEQLEVIKGQTPDRGAESLGGTVNMKSRSALNMREKRRITYNFTTAIAPSFTQQIPLREKRRYHPLLNFGYQELFSVFGQQRNLGVTVNLFYDENAIGGFRTDRDFQNTPNSPAFVWDYQTYDNYNNYRQSSANVKVDYRLSHSTRLSVNATGNDNIERFRRSYFTRAYTANQNQDTVPNATTTSIVPGYTDRITTVRAVPTSTIDMTMTGPINYYVRMRRLDLSADQDFGPLQLDYTARYSRTNLNNGGGQGGTLINRITNVGWILDRTQSDLYPRFIQNGGPDFTDYRNWRPAPANALTNADNQQDQRIREVRANARYLLSPQLKTSVKVGGQWRELLVQIHNATRRWNYIGTGPLPADPTLLMWDQVKTGRRMPQWESSQFIRNRQPIDPTLWSEDLYNREQLKYSGAREGTETVTAGYAMVEGRFGRDGFLGRTGYLGGVRTEKTETEAFGWSKIRGTLASTPAQQQSDPVGSAARDYAGTKRALTGSYTKSFPSVHLMHDITPDLKARVSWSTSFGRPGIGELFPAETANESARTVTINNPSLLPQMATNWDATLDYYFEPVGNFSAGWFHKSIKDYIVRNINSGTVGNGNDNGFNGDYPGFTRFTSANAGTAVVQGWEFSYQQQFTFLPGLLKGFAVAANYTLLSTHGDFGGTTILGTSQVVGFIPRAANVMVSWRYRSFSARILHNMTGSYIAEYSAASPGRNLYRYRMDRVNLGLAYQLRPSVSLTCDINNLFNEPQRLYRGIPDHMARTIINGTTINVGVSGRF